MTIHQGFMLILAAFVRVSAINALTIADIR